MARPGGSIGELNGDSVGVRVQLLHAQPGVRGAAQKISERLSVAAAYHAAVGIAEQAGAIAARCHLCGDAVGYDLVERLEVRGALNGPKLTERDVSRCCRPRWVQ